MADYYYERETRTPHSESYLIDDEEGQHIGRVDIHYVPSGPVHATLCVGEGMTEEDLEDLIGDVDERLVMTADPFREDFVVSVWRGRSAGVYSEESLDLEEDLDDGQNGHR
ncbi:MAG TPA: hypothetical protein VNL92_00760 [Dehalococcoidia bacterium]|nr:hypothetical protein [Dehalococcoidia bacterium]